VLKGDKEMRQFNFSELSLPILQSIVRLRQKGAADYEWAYADEIALTEEETLIVRHITSRLKYFSAHLMNEATLWARAVYPLLQLAEQGDILASSEAHLSAAYPKFWLHGTADGILAKCIAGNIETPYLIVAEGKNPQPQLYGELLASAQLNREENSREEQEIFGAYIIADAWTFVRGLVSEMDSDRPFILIEHSREYSVKSEADAVLKILKSVVVKNLNPDQAGIRG
jgi:hypothetical protein